MKRLFLIVTLLACAFITGCASVPLASVEQDTQAKSFKTKPGKANVYVYRNETFGAAVKLNLDVDGKALAGTGAKTYVALELDPGKHSIASKGENDSTLDVIAEAGKNYFVWQEVKMGMFSARSQLQLVDDATGRAGVAECKLIETAANFSVANCAVTEKTATATSSSVNEKARAAPASADRISVNDGAGDVVVQKVEFRAGVSSATVERLAKRHGCTGGGGAGLITEKGPMEIYRMQCENNTVFMAQCELRQCRPMR